MLPLQAFCCLEQSLRSWQRLVSSVCSLYAAKLHCAPCSSLACRAVPNHPLAAKALKENRIYRYAIIRTLSRLRGPSRCAVYELDGPDRSGVTKLFRKPWMMTTIMFIGMSFCIPIGYIDDYWQRRKQLKAMALFCDHLYGMAGSIFEVSIVIVQCGSPNR